MKLGQYADIDPRARRHSCAKRLNHERLHSQDVLSMLRLRKSERKAKDALQSLRYSAGCVDPALENNEGRVALPGSSFKPTAAVVFPVTLDSQQVACPAARYASPFPPMEPPRVAARRHEEAR